MKIYREANICKNPTPAGNPFFNIDELNALSKDGWKLVYVFNDDNFLRTHKIIKALFAKDVDEITVNETANTEAVKVEKRGPGRPPKAQVNG